MQDITNMIKNVIDNISKLGIMVNTFHNISKIASNMPCVAHDSDVLVEHDGMVIMIN